MSQDSDKKPTDASVCSEDSVNNFEMRCEVFVREYLVDFNGSRAAIAAGYSKKTARMQASRLLTNDNVQKALKAAQAERLERLDLTADKVMREVANLAFANMSDLVDWNNNGVEMRDSKDLPASVKAAVQEIGHSYDETSGHPVIEDGEISLSGGKRRGSAKIKLHDKLKALELCGKYLGIWKEQPEAPTGAQVATDVNAIAAAVAELLQKGGKGERFE